MPLRTPLAVAKLRAPTLGPDIVRRPHVRERLRSGFAGPLTLVTAPAGYGKTTALLGALAEHPGAWGWVSLDAHDNDLPTFVQYVVGAVRTVHPDAGKSTLSLLRQSRQPSPHLVARTLANELAAMPQAFVLVLDEFDEVRDPLVLAFLDALLRLPVAEFRLAIASRHRPGLALGRLRSRGLLAEVHAEQLRFTLGETREFLERSLDVVVPDEIVASVDARAEGWPAGVRLIAQSAARRPGADGLMQALGEVSATAIHEYLWEEVLTDLPAEAQDFLAPTALFDRVCIALAEAALARPIDRDACQRLLEQLAQANVFVVGLDEHGTWFRYHRLFRQALRQRRAERWSPAEQADVLRRASAWFAAQALTEEAVDHALLAGDVDGAAELVERASPDAFNREEWPRVERWLAQLPKNAAQTRPGLLVARAWIRQLRAQTADIPALADAAEALLLSAAVDDPRVRVLGGQISILRGGAKILAGDSRPGLEEVRAGWEQVPTDLVYARRVAISYWAIAAQATGEGASLLRTLEAERAAAEHEMVYAEGLAFGIAYHLLAEGTLHQAAAVMATLLQAVSDDNYALSAAWANFLLGRVYYEQDDLDRAETHFRAVVERRDRAHFLPLQGSQFGLALTLAATGDRVGAEHLLRSVTDAALQTWGPVHLETLRSLRGRLALEHDDVGTAMRWLPPLESDLRFVPVFAVEVPALTRARAALALGSAGVATAAASADALADAFARWHDVPHLVQALAVRALAHDARHERDAALRVLERAVRLATPGGMTRTFLDLGPSMAQLVDALAGAGGGGEHAARLRMAFGRAGAAVPASATGILAEPLTPRETEVLKLLQVRLTDREIAAALHVSRETVHTHTRNLYQKLQVERRRDAVVEALRLGLISEP